MFSCNVFRGVLSFLLGDLGGAGVLVCFGASAWCGQGTLLHSCVRLHFSFGVAGIFAPARIKNKSDERTLFYHRFCGQRWIRTTEGVSQQIYSLPHLATLVFALLSLLSDSNQRPRDYKSRALANWAKEAYSNLQPHSYRAKRLQS